MAGIDELLEEYYETGDAEAVMKQPNTLDDFENIFGPPDTAATGDIDDITNINNVEMLDPEDLENIKQLENGYAQVLPEPPVEAQTAETKVAVAQSRRKAKGVPQATFPEEDENVPKRRKPKDVRKPKNAVAAVPKQRKNHVPAQNAIRYLPTTRIPTIRPGVLTNRDDIALRLKNPKTMTDYEKMAFDMAAPEPKPGDRPLCRVTEGQQFQGRRCGRPTGQHPRVMDPRVEQDMIHPWEEKYVKKLVETRMVKRKRLIHFIIAYLYANTVGKGKESVEFKQLDRALCVVPLFSDWRNDVNTIKQYRRKSGPNVQMFVRRIRYRDQKTDRRSTSHTDYRHPILFDAPAPGMWALNPRFLKVVQDLHLLEKFNQNIEELLKDIKNNCEPQNLALNDDE